ncbi:DUF982 domain-containing protein [Mesorhizobium sp. B2-3-4]|uniref:DUF982 domain-containing protein n=1 Tax=Mesorhizobium sp. B2-3-4 TaxID=2589959 RepID=UPI0015E425B8|nr:DUF982 domain-containing protein [Mesorhizobium sp. B2-3-4]
MAALAPLKTLLAPCCAVDRLHVDWEWVGSLAGTNQAVGSSTRQSCGVGRMRDENFDIPVTIETSQTGRYLTVTRTAQAASLLLEKWPTTRGPKYRAALKAMRDVLEQRKTVSVGRKAFTAAAKEADVFVREGRDFA